MSDELPRIISDEEFAALLKQRKQSDLSKDTECWDNAPPAPLDSGHDGRPESTLEQRFQRIAQKLVLVWRSDDCSSYIKNLVFSDRDDRQGFPPEVVEDLIMLYEINERLLHRSTQGPEPGIRFSGYRRPVSGK